MRIIHIVHGKANPEGHNGISLVVYNMNKYERIAGINSEIWALVDGTKKHYTHRRDEYVSIECYPRVSVPFGRNEIIDELIKNKNSIDLVHFHLIWNLDKNFIANALKKNDMPFIITSHGTYSKPHAYTGKRLIAKWLYECKFLNMAKEIHIITREEGTGLKTYGYEGKSFVAYNGVDIKKVPTTRNINFFKNKNYDNKIKISWVGVLRDDKNLKSLVEAIAMIDESIRKNLIIILIGPDYRDNSLKILNYARKLGCESNIEYIGPLYAQDKYDALESSDLYVMPSLSEVFSLAVIDAMACKKPMLITSGCGLNYISEKKFAVICESYSQDIYRGLMELLNLENQWQMMGEAALNIVNEKLNWENISKEMIKNYERITNE